MKKILMAGTMLATMTGLAVAADLPSRMAPPPVFTQLPPVFTWTGVYAGLNAGYAFDYGGHNSTNAGGLIAGVPARLNTDADGFTGGGQIGYNYQFGAGSGIVVGVEADAAYTDLDEKKTLGDGTGATTTFRSGLDYLGTVRGRVGYGFGQVLVYGTGGFAYGGVNDRASTTDTFGALAFTGRNTDTRTGYVYGGGIEYALPTASFLNFFHSSAVTLKAEYLHYDLGRSTVFALNGAGGTAYTARFQNDGDLARIGINYKFGSY